MTWMSRVDLMEALGARERADPGRYVRQWCKRNGVPIHEATRGTWRVLREDFDNAFKPRKNHPTHADEQANEAFAVFAAWKDTG